MATRRIPQSPFTRKRPHFIMRPYIRNLNVNCFCRKVTEPLITHIINIIFILIWKVTLPNGTVAKFLSRYFCVLSWKLFNASCSFDQGCSRLIDKRIEAIEKNRKSPPSSGASAFVIDIFSQAPLIEID